MKEEFFTGLDIGSYAIRIAVLQTVGDGRTQITGSAELPSQGVSKGSVVSIEDTVSVVSEALEAAERMTGRSITKAAVGISGTHVMTQESRGVIAVSRADGEVKDDDVDRVIEAAQAVASPPNYDVLHVIPIQFAVDNQTNIKDPVGMSGVRLETVVQMVHGLSGEIKNITKTAHRTGLEIDDLVLSILACAEAVLTKQQKELGVALVNIGASTTSVAVFEDGDLLLARVIPIGSAHITSDLAIGLRTSIDTAERIKLGVGRVADKKTSKRDEVDLSQFSGDEDGTASLLEINKIIEARLEEIFDHVNEKLSEIGRAGRLPAGIVLTGGGANLPGIIDYAKVSYRLPASLGFPVHAKSTIEKTDSLEFSTAVGLALWDMEWQKSSPGGIKIPGGGNISGVVGSLKSKLGNIFR